MPYTIYNKIITITKETPVGIKQWNISCPAGIEGVINVEKNMLKLNNMCLEKFGSIPIIEEDKKNNEEILSVLE